MRVGSRYSGSAAHFLDAQVDEVRISKTDRSATWIETTYNTISTPATFLYFGAEQAIGGSNNVPVNDGLTVVDADDTDNWYAQKQSYTVTSNHSDADGFADIDYVEIGIWDSSQSSERCTVRFDEDTATFSIQAGDTKWELNTGSCSNVSSSNDLDITWEISVEWDADSESGCDIKVYITDDEPETDTDWYDDQLDVVTDLLVSSIEADDANDPDRVDVSGTPTVSFSVRYENDPSSGSASSSYPPNAEFTSCSIYDVADNNEGTDSSIVNGDGSVAVTVPSSAGTDNYNVYVNMADADYSDGEESPTETIISDRLEFVSIAEDTSDQRIDLSANFELRFQIKYDYDDVEFDDGKGSISGFVWDSDNSWWDKTVTGSASVTLTNYDETDISITDSTYALTVKEDEGGVNIITDRIMVYYEALDDSRVDINTNIEWRLKAVLDYDESALGSGDGITTGWGATSWDAGNSWFDISHSEASVTGVTVTISSGSEATYTITSIAENITETTGIYDRLEIISVAFSDDRVDVSGSSEARYVIYYDYDNVEFDDGKGSITGFAWDEDNGWWDKSVTAPASPSAELYDENDISITDSTYGITSVEDDAGASLIGDRIQCDSLGLIDSRINADNSDTTTLYGTFSLEYDSHALGSGDSINVEGIVLSWDGGDSRFEGTTAASASVTSTTYDTFTSGSEATYTITAVNINSKSTVLIYDKTQVQSYSVNDSRVDVDDIVWVEATLDYDFDNSDVTDGTVTINGESTTHEGSGVWRAKVTKSSVQAVTYNTIVATGNTHGITEEDQNGQSQEVIWDQIIVISYTASDTRANINDNVNVDVTIDYDYDDSDVTDGTVTINGESASHQGSGVWRATVSKSSVQAVTYNTVVATGNANGITSVNQDSKSQEVIWDRIMIYWEALDDSRVDINSNIEFRYKAVLDYDESALGSGDGITTSWGATSWDAGNGWFDISHSEVSVTGVTVTFSAGSEATYGITAYAENITETTGIYDRLEVVSVAFSDDRIDVSGSSEVRYKFQYDYDNVAFDSGKGSISGFVWDSDNSWWDKTVTGSSSVTSTTYDEGDVSITDSTYGLTSKEDDSGAELITDRIKILTLTAVDATVIVNNEGKWQSTAELEYDSHALGSGDSFTLSSYAFTWNGTSSKFEATDTKSEPETVTVNAFDSGTEDTYGITEGNINSLSQGIEWRGGINISDVSVTASSGTFESVFTVSVIWSHNGSAFNDATCYVYDSDSLLGSGVSNSSGIAIVTLTDETIMNSGTLTVNASTEYAPNILDETVVFDISASGLTIVTPTDWTVGEAKNVIVSFDNDGSIDSIDVMLENVTVTFNVISGGSIVKSDESSKFSVSAGTTHNDTYSLTITGVESGDAILQTVIKQYGSTVTLTSANSTVSIGGGGGSVGGGGGSITVPLKPIPTDQDNELLTMTFFGGALNVYPGLFTASPAWDVTLANDEQVNATVVLDCWIEDLEGNMVWSDTIDEDPVSGGVFIVPADKSRTITVIGNVPGSGRYMFYTILHTENVYVETEASQDFNVTWEPYAFLGGIVVLVGIFTAVAYTDPVAWKLRFEELKDRILGESKDNLNNY